MFLIVPYRTEVLLERLPITNILIIGSCIFVFFLMIFGGMSENLIGSMILDGWNPIGIIGHMFLHGGLFHIFFNLLYLWIFGNAVSEKVGPWKFLGVYFITGLGAAIAHNVFSGSPAVGASGAINGIIGFYFLLYPINKIHCWYFILFRPGTFSIRGYWLIILWFVVDIWGAVEGGGNIAYGAHIGGFLTGMVLGVLFLKKKWVIMSKYDNPSLFGYMFKGWKDNVPEEKIEKPFKHPETYNTPEPEKNTPIPFNPSPPKDNIAEMFDSDDIIPLASEKKKDVNIDCPHCNQNLDVPHQMVPGQIECPACSGSIEVMA